VRTAARTAGASEPRDRPAQSADPADRPSTAPVIVLAPVYSGAGTLRSLLAGHPDLACTAGTGLLPLCEQAMLTWGNADGRPGRPPSSLARTTTRALVASVITSILIREGKPRWCEVAAVNPEAAEAFRQLYPGTKFLCLYRSCPGFIRAALDVSPWGLADPMFAPFTRVYPGSTAAGLTACWVAQASTLLAFEQAHPGDCLRVRYEDLTGDQSAAAARVTSFLGLTSPGGWSVHGGPNEPPPAISDVGPPASLPDGLIPPALRTQADDLLQQLNYPPMTAAD
jgi:Sulfotransferase family